MADGDREHAESAVDVVGIHSGQQQLLAHEQLFAKALVDAAVDDLQHSRVLVSVHKGVVLHLAKHWAPRHLFGNRPERHELGHFCLQSLQILLALEKTSTEIIHDLLRDWQHAPELHAVALHRLLVVCPAQMQQHRLLMMQQM